MLKKYFEKSIELSLMAIVFIVPVIFFTRTNDVFEINKMFVFRFFTFYSIGLWLLIFLIEKKIIVRKTVLDFPVIGFLLASILATIITKNRTVSIYGVYEDFEGIITIINYVLFFYLATNFIKTKKDVFKYVYVILGATFIISLYGLAQNLGWDFVKWNPETYSPERFFSTLGNPNFLAAYLVETIPIIFILFFITDKTPGKLFILIVLILSIVILFLTKSRAGFLSFLVTVFFILIYTFLDARKKENELFSKNKIWFMFFALTIILTLFLPIVREAFQTLWERSRNLFSFKGIILTPRIYIWKSALMMFKDNPILGTGVDTFQVIFPYYRLPIYWQLEWNGTPEKTHNVFLQILSTEGIIGFGFYLLLFVTFLKKSFNLIFGEKDITRRYLIFGFFMAVIAFYVQGLFNYTVVAYGSFFWFSLSIICSQETTNKKYRMFDISRNFIEKNKIILYGMTLIIFVVLQVLFARYWTGDLYFKIGNIAVSTDKEEYCIPYYAKAVEFNPMREIYWVKYGIGYEKIIRKEPNPEKKLFYINEALKIHNNTIKLNKMNGYNYNNVARVYKAYGELLDRSKFREAIEFYNEAIKRDPNNAYFGLDLATVYINIGAFDKAIDLCKRYSELYPDYAVPLSYIGYTYMLQGPDKLNEAKTYYEQAISKPQWHGDFVTQASTYSNLGIIYFNLNMLKESTEMFKKVIELRPDYVEGYLNLGKLYVLLKNKEEAINVYEQALKINPGDERILQSLNQIKR
ncbi:MAG TPA: O-antigen ligase family protein [Candidatus Goldiibacteriota bacterium]|nr:O-antigen ligase family protein [Candidatus Goldiibacteriota bacterium]